MLPVVSDQVRSTENAMSKSCRVILYTFVDEFTTFYPDHPSMIKQTLPV